MRTLAKIATFVYIFLRMVFILMIGLACAIITINVDFDWSNLWTVVVEATAWIVAIICGFKAGDDILTLWRIEEFWKTVLQD